MKRFGTVAVATAGEPSIASSANPSTINRTLSILVNDSAFPLLAVFDILYPLDFLLVTNVKLLFIHRIYTVAIKTTTFHPAVRTLCFAPHSFKTLTVAINAVNVVGIVLRFIAAHYMMQASFFANSLVYNPGQAALSYKSVSLLLDAVDQSKKFASYQLTMEAAVLTSMAMVRARKLSSHMRDVSVSISSTLWLQALVTASLAFWAHSRRFSTRAAATTLLPVESSSATHNSMNNTYSNSLIQAAAVSRTALFCAAFVVFSIVFRMIFAIPFALASYADRNDLLQCPSPCDGSCQKTWFLVYQWIANQSWIRVAFIIVRWCATCNLRLVTTALQLLRPHTFLSEPMAMAVAVWGIVSPSPLPRQPHLNLEVSASAASEPISRAKKFHNFLTTSTRYDLVQAAGSNEGTES
jgi:hypothetical protein